jgi:rod shape-determining protein MreC
LRRDRRQTRLIFGLLLTVALVFLTVDYREGRNSPLGPLRGIGAAVFAPIERVTAVVTEPVGRFVSAIAAAPEAEQRNRLLRAENERLKGELTAARLDKRRSEELRRLLGLAGLGGYKIVTGQVIARRGVPGFEDAVEIDIGTLDGVRPDMTVLNGAGLVGRVVHAGPMTSSVALLSDPALSAGARLEASDEIGVVNGVGEHGDRIRFRLLDSTAPLTAGARIVSFGSHRGAPYVPGVPIGVIERVEATPGELTRIAYARAYADLTALDLIGVVVAAPARDPRDAVLPARPKQDKKDQAQTAGEKDPPGARPARRDRG